ncbi:MAG: glycosyltransferase family 4 protein [Planctomycetales bacterium]|nr:glycosyltransferase family 4 protein [Planctomycetales bacterium]
MRVAYVCCDPGIPVFGSKGCSVHVQEVVRELLDRGAHVDLIAYRLGGEALWNGPQFRIVHLPPPSAANEQERARALYLQNARVVDVLQAAEPYDLVYERHALYAYAGMQFARSQGMASVLEVNAPLIEEQQRYRTLGDRRLAERAALTALNDAGQVVAVSEEVADYVRTVRRRDDRVFAIPNGVDVRRFDNSPRDARGTVTIGFVGTLKPWHGVSRLIDAFGKLAQQLVETKLVIVGDGPQRDDLIAQAKALHPQISSRIEFTGAVSPTAIPSQLARFDVAVAPYGDDASFYFSPLKLFEYMAAGLPVVASRIGQIPQVLTSDCGVLCSPGSTSELVSALDALCRDAPLRARLGAAGRLHVSARHTWSAVVDQILQLASPLAALG